MVALNTGPCMIQVIVPQINTCYFLVFRSFLSIVRTIVTSWTLLATVYDDQLFKFLIATLCLHYYCAVAAMAIVRKSGWGCACARVITADGRPIISKLR